MSRNIKPVSTWLPKHLRSEQVLATTSQKQCEQSSITDDDTTKQAERVKQFLQYIYLWPGGRLYYIFDPDCCMTGKSDRKHVKTAMDFIEFTTNSIIRFIPLREEKADSGGYMVVKKDDNYEATLGYQLNAPSTLSVIENDFYGKEGKIAHELLHALGITHEHNRPDRDQFVEICWDNILEDQRHNFVINKENLYETFGVPYNYYSTMHYSSHSFAKDENRPTIIFKDPNITKEIIGQRYFLTEEDICLLKKKYILEAPGINPYKNALDLLC